MKFRKWHNEKDKNVPSNEFRDIVKFWTWNLKNLLEIFGPEIFKNLNKFLVGGSISQEVENI